MERTKIGLNRTGMKTSPILSKEMREITELTEPSMEGDASLMAKERVRIAKESEPMGTMPPPGSMKEAATTAAKMLTGKKAPVFVDKLGERMAFERSGVRLYDAAISKFDAFGSWKGGPSRADLVHIRDEELRHFHLVKDTIDHLGSDSTAVTPSANIAAVSSMGLFQVCSDPRTSLQQTLEAILIAELTDNDCWENLIDLSRAMGRDDLASEFMEALDNEREHLRNVRAWLGAALSEDATHRELAEPFSARGAKRDGVMAQRNRQLRASVPVADRTRPKTVVAQGKAKTGRVTTKTASARTVRQPGGRTTKKKR